MRRGVIGGLVAGWLLATGGVSGVAVAGEKPLFGPPQAWVKPVPLPKASPDSNLPVQFLLVDQQHAFDADSHKTYVEMAYRVKGAQGIQAAGALNLVWRPEVATLTVHKIQLRRGDAVIDVLKDGSGLSVLRPAGEVLVLTGAAVGALQIEGLQDGDIVDYSYTIDTKEPALAGHADAVLPSLGGSDLQLMHASARWPRNSKMKWKAYNLPGDVAVRQEGDQQEVSFSKIKPEAFDAPDDAPGRFRLSPRLEVSDFASWSDVAALDAPLYDKARKLAPNSALNAEIARIRAASDDPKVRAAMALALVEDNVRYLAVLLNQGGFVPATADETWTRRYGDCKAKTVLLMALLDGLGITAEPAAVSSSEGDGLDQRLPRFGAFDHVIVRAQIGGKTYWLDGTRTGDKSLDALTTPPYAWALPLRATGAALEPLTRLASDQPDYETNLRIDASRGVQVTAPIHAEIVARGEDAASIREKAATWSKEDGAKFAREVFFDALSEAERGAASVTTASFSFDEIGNLHVVADGQLPMTWVKKPNGVRERDVHNAKLSVDDDFSDIKADRKPVPFAIDFPSYGVWRETILLPKAGEGFAAVGGDVDQTVGGRAFHRRTKIENGALTMEASIKSLKAEVDFAEANAAAPILRQLASGTETVSAPEVLFTEAARQADIMALDPKSADDYLARAQVHILQAKYADAVLEVNKAIGMGMVGPTPYGVLGYALQATGKYDDARAAFDKALAAKPNPVATKAIKTSLALMEMQRGKPQAALDGVNALLAEQPHDVGLLRTRSEIYRDMGDLDHALADAQAAMKEEPANMDLYRAANAIALRQNPPTKVVELAKAAIAANPTDPAIIRQVGIQLCLSGQRTECMSALDQSIRLAPTAPSYLSRARFRSPTEAEARNDDLAAAVRLDPSQNTFATVAGVQADAGDYAASIETLQKLISMSDIPIWHMHLGAAYERTGQHQQAETEYALVREKAGQDASQLNGLCWQYATANVQLERALKDCDAALALKRETHTLDSRGFVLLRLKRYDEAIRAYDDAIALGPPPAESFYGRGLARLRKGQAENGRGDLAHARSLSPGIDLEFAAYGLTP